MQMAACKRIGTHALVPARVLDLPRTRDRRRPVEGRRSADRADVARPVRRHRRGALPRRPQRDDPRDPRRRPRRALGAHRPGRHGALGAHRDHRGDRRPASGSGRTAATARRSCNSARSAAWPTSPRSSSCARVPDEPRVHDRGQTPIVHLADRGRLSRRPGVGRVLAQEALADDLLIDGRLADVALPLESVARERAAAAVDVLARVDARLDGALPFGLPARR